jgi:hypothetical protein
MDTAKKGVNMPYYSDHTIEEIKQESYDQGIKEAMLKVEKLLEGYEFFKCCFDDNVRIRFVKALTRELNIER